MNAAGRRSRKLADVEIGDEPLWAIGTGNMPFAEEIVEIHTHFRRYLIARFGGRQKEVRILYGDGLTAWNKSRV